MGGNRKKGNAVLAIVGVIAAAAALGLLYRHVKLQEDSRMNTQAQAAEVTANFSLPMLGLEHARPLLRNPDRGLRMETYITLGETPESYPGNPQDPYEKLLGMIAKYEDESPTVVQLYVYLTHYNEKPLDEAAFAQLERMLELCRDNNLRVLLRFTYQNESYPDPDWPRVKGHLEQLGEWFQSRSQLLDDTLCAMQAGIVGYWGEGHSYVNFKKKYIGRAFNQLISITPEDVFVQVRTIDLMDMVAPKHKDRLGMHDDYIIGEINGPWSFFNGRSGKEERRIEAGFSRSINDAEMPWGRATYYDRADGHPLDSMDAAPILQQLKQYALTTFSLEHNYREGGEEQVYSMARWREEFISPAQLEAQGMPYHPALVGSEVSVFDYIQYHLGYLLSITAFELDAEERMVRFTIQNNGLAAPLNCNALSVVAGGEEVAVDSYDKYALGSMQAVTYTVPLPEGFDAQTQRLGIKLSRRAGSSICARFVNDTEFTDGVQWMR